MNQINPPCHHPLSSKGFTLIEMIMVMVIIGILVGIAIPSFQSFTRSSQVTSAANDLVSAFNLARSEAVARSSRVTVCKSDDQATCDVAIDWHDGWIVFEDLNGDGVVDAGDTILRVYAAARGVTIIGGTDLEDNVTFLPSGFLPDDKLTYNPAVDPEPVISVTSNDGARVITLSFSRTGRVSAN